MKKLMLTAAAAALAGVACATNIYDYKASVKYVDMKTVSAKTDDGVKAKVYVKVVKSATLTGYLVTPVEDCACAYEDTDLCRFGMAPGFLVIQNKAQRKNDLMNSYVKLMPANLLTEWWSTASLANAKKSMTLKAQGYLFAGVGKRDVPDPVASPHYGLGDYGVPGAHDTTARTAATQCLFGALNILDGATFIEPFLDQAGFGKAKYTYTKGVIKGDKNPCLFTGDDPWEDYEICLTSLSGTLIGGSFLCMVNGQAIINGQLVSAWVNSEDWLCQGWDNHTENWTTAGGTNLMPQDFTASTEYMYNVICGTWSIKASKLVSNCNVSADVTMCGQKLDKSFQLGTFDKSAKDALNTYAGEFVTKWGL